MRQIITFIIFVMFLTSCIDETKHGIEGDWLGYEKTSILGNDTVTENFHLILSIGKDSIRAINFKFITNGDRDSLSAFSYIASGSNLLINNHTKSVDTFSIDVLNDTAMILSTSNNKYKYSRLLKSEPETQRIELSEKMFTISDSVQIIDTLEFLDHSSLLTYNQILERQPQFYEWRLREYLGHELLIIDSHEIPVFLIELSEGKHFKLKREPKEIPKYYLSQTDFQQKLNRNMLIGEWTGKSNIPADVVSFRFDNDSVQMNEFTGGETVTGTYSLNLSGTKMFCSHKFTGEILFYEIEKMSGDSLILNRLAPIEDSFVLKRVK